jgi:acetyl-CoA acyltransferase
MALNPVYICDALRTPVGRYGGTLAGVRPDDLAAGVLRALCERAAKLDPAAIDEVYLGCANQSGEDSRNVARMAILLSGLPEMVPGSTVNRLCGSGLESIALAARAISAGEATVAIGGGVESMSRAPFIIGKSDQAFSRNAKIEDSTIGWRFVNRLMQERFGTESMAETAENVADEHKISRVDQDAFALRSQQRYARALQAGFFANEIVPVTVPQGRGAVVNVTADEHPRADTTLEALAKLKPIVRPTGSITAGNASGINDGSAAVLLAGEAAVKRHGLTPRARVVATATAGVLPRVMGIGPVPATRKLFERTGFSAERIDVFELNEAFAAQSLGVLRQLGFADDDPRVNPNGGAIAIGHPLGASGARLVTTALNQLDQHGGRHALISMCIGVGQGISMLLERT